MAPLIPIIASIAGIAGGSAVAGAAGLGVLGATGLMAAGGALGGTLGAVASNQPIGLNAALGGFSGLGSGALGLGSAARLASQSAAAPSLGNFGAQLGLGSAAPSLGNFGAGASLGSMLTGAAPMAGGSFLKNWGPTLATGTLMGLPAAFSMYNQGRQKQYPPGGVEYGPQSSLAATGIARAMAQNFIQQRRQRMGLV